MATINVRMDDDLKKDFEQFCSNVGMNMTTAISIFAKTVVKEQRIPFDISSDPFYNPANMNRIRKSVQDLDKGKGKSHELIEV